MKKKNLFILVILIIVVLALIFWNLNKKEADNKVIRIGVISTLTGPASYYGKSTMMGAEVGKLVAESRFPNLKIELYHEDSLFSPKGGIDAYNKLRSINHIDAVITQASNIGVAVQPIALKDGILQVSASVLANNYSTANDLSFRLTAKADLEIAPVVKYFKEKKFKKISILAMNNEIGVSLSESLKKDLEGSDIKIVSYDSFPADSVDFKSQLSKIKLNNPDAIYLATVSVLTSNILKQADNLGIVGPSFSYRGAEDPSLVNNAKYLASRLIYTNAFDSDSDNRETKDFVYYWKQKYNEDSNGYAAEAYESVLLIAEVFNQCGKDYNCIQNNLNKIKNHPSVFGPYSFDINGDVSYPFFLKTVKGDKFVKL